jgi:hypothetical protein
MADGDPGAPAAAPERPRRRGWSLLLAVVAALAVGVGLGYLWRSATEPAPPPVAAPPAPAPPTTSPPAAPSPCAAIAQRGNDLLAQLEAAARAAGALDPAALRQVLDEVRRLRDELQRDVDACRGQTGAGPLPGSSLPNGPPGGLPPGGPVPSDPAPGGAGAGAPIPGDPTAATPVLEPVRSR